MSLTDLMVAVAGCAVGYSLRPFYLAWVKSGDLYATGSFLYQSPFWTFRTPLLILGFALAAVIIVRQARYGRMPRSAEWPALVFAAELVSTGVLDRAYDLGATGPAKVTLWNPQQWPWALAWSLLALAGLIAVAALWRRVPPWVRALSLAALAAMWLCGPAHVYRKQATGAPPQPLGSASTWAFQLRWSAWLDSGRWPELILFGIPIVAGLRDRTRSGRRAWTWTEWTGLGLGLVLAACWWLDRFAASDATNPARLANVVLRGGWLVGIGVASYLILRACDVVRARLIPSARSPGS
jgi:hypothetical protein